MSATKKLVLVTREVVRVSCRAVGATIDMRPWFSMGAGVGAYCCWHAARVHHRCRMLFPSDSACERVGSLLRLFWEPRAGEASPSSLVDKVFLHQAGVDCLGSPRDEMLISEVARLLQDTSKYQMKEAAQGFAVPFGVQDRHSSLRAGGHDLDCLAAEALSALEPSEMVGLRKGGVAKRQQFLRARSASSKPLQLPDSVARAVSCATYAKSGMVRALPVDVLALHAAQRGAASSVLRSKIATWLQSEDGRRWQADRDRIFADERGGDTT